ncbi:MAG: DNA alkylation repair protein [Clostridia bacterium]|nr:DNA alkylation repair protein [Clostridia bacterium]
MKQEIREKLISLSENKYREFSSALVPNSDNMLGVRLPKLRKLAAEIAVNDDLSCFDGEDIYFEETMLRGMVIGALKIDTEKRFELISDFVPLINNWSVCDSFCASLKFISKNKSLMWDFIESYCYSEKEFYQRFGAVIMLDYFVDEEYIEYTLKRLSEIKTAKYYSSMAVAWAVSVCYVKFPEETKAFLLSGVLDDDTYNRTIRKICDSYRVQKADKDFLKTTIRKKEKCL